MFKLAPVFEYTLADTRAGKYFCGLAKFIPYPTVRRAKTQRQLIRGLMGPKLDLRTEYIHCVYTVTFSISFALIFPGILLLGAMAMVLKHFQLRLRLIKICQRPAPMSGDVMIGVTRLHAWPICLFFLLPLPMAYALTALGGETKPKPDGNQQPFDSSSMFAAMVAAGFGVVVAYTGITFLLHFARMSCLAPMLQAMKPMSSELRARQRLKQSALDALDAEDSKTREQQPIGHLAKSHNRLRRKIFPRQDWHSYPSYETCSQVYEAELRQRWYGSPETHLPPTVQTTTC